MYYSESRNEAATLPLFSSDQGSFRMARKEKRPWSRHNQIYVIRIINEGSSTSKNIVMRIQDNHKICSGPLKVCSVCSFRQRTPKHQCEFCGGRLQLTVMTPYTIIDPEKPRKTKLIYKEERLWY